MDKILDMMKKAGRNAFRTSEYTALLGKKGYARLVLHRLKVKGQIISIKNGWWAFPDAMPEAIASEVSKPCYISFHSALFLHGLTSQTPRKVQVAVIRKTKTYKIQGTHGFEIKEYKIKKNEFNKFYRKDGIMLAIPAKALADALTLPRTCPEIVIKEALGNMDISDLTMTEPLIHTSAAKKRLKRLIKYVRKNRTD
ncbi:hypothetical protein KKF81_01895 [Candidatus Micrarchaeota archaeon]|nr:hypothetical protein [Candidatus Micrarchaeota archaeon]MBU1165672.1 hypothetical protein [Candidatus Micrarchaeota archaeon]MBU1886747.1 hypothetical protein [Candidatus Micrarchaeota archaeon]